jgi:hypothetical protein
MALGGEETIPVRILLKILHVEDLILSTWIFEKNRNWTLETFYY